MRQRIFLCVVEGSAHKGERCLVALLLRSTACSRRLDKRVDRKGPNRLVTGSLLPLASCRRCDT